MTERQVPVKVVDSIMGTGKTTGMFKLMDEEHSKTKKKFFYVSLFNSEVGEGNGGETGRIHEALPHMSFKMPKNRGGGKKENIKDLMSKGYNISTTHTSFKAFDKEAIELMVEKDYTLVIDEAMDCISQYKDLTTDDLDMLYDSGRVVSDAVDGKLTWVGKEVSKESKFHEVMQLCFTESLYRYGTDLVLWEYPPLLLKVLKDVYVITYLFEGSIMCSWMKKNNIDYVPLPDEVLGLRDAKEVKDVIRSNLEILKSHKLNKLREEVKGKEHQFSSGWYKRNLNKDGAKDGDKQLLPPTEMSQRITKILESTVTRCKVSNRNVFWTTFKDYKKGVAGKGFKQKPRDGLEPFLSYNTKATNDYRDHTLCLYGVNVFKTPTEINYLRDRGIIFDTDRYSLSEAVQYLFRGCIRKGEHMKVLILSERMEKLVLEWLDED